MTHNAMRQDTETDGAVHPHEVPHKVDSWLLASAQRVHLLLMRVGFYPALLSTLLCFGLFGLRAYMSRTWTFAFLLWNLFLAWVPYLASLAAVLVYRRNPRLWLALCLLGALAIAFFPNAPYIVTDFLHLGERAPMPLWYDIGLITSFAWSGLVVGVYALRLLQDIVKFWLGRILSWVFALVVILLSGMGIYMGRFLRWNSWDLVTQPKAILYDIAVRLRSPLGNPGTYGVTLLFAAVMFVCYLALTVGPSNWQD